jgi:hypothetical protein
MCIAFRPCKIVTIFCRQLPCFSVSATEPLSSIEFPKTVICNHYKLRWVTLNHIVHMCQLQPLQAQVGHLKPYRAYVSAATTAISGRSYPISAATSTTSDGPSLTTVSCIRISCEHYKFRWSLKTMSGIPCVLSGATTSSDESSLIIMSCICISCNHYCT